MTSDSTPTTGTTADAQSAGSFHASALAASLTVNDLRTSVAWYAGVVGFAIERRIEREGALRAVALRAGDVRLMLTQDDGARGADRVKGAGFSLMITTAQNIDGIAARIRERGGTLDADPADTPWGTRAFRLHDPDGFKLVISS